MSCAPRRCRAPGSSAHLGVPVTLKLELLQRSGSFKARGAIAKIASLSAEERAAGIVAVSGGNHGIAVADAAGALGVAATVVMPESAPARSVEIARAAGADVRLTETWTARSRCSTSWWRPGPRWCTRSTTRSWSPHRAPRGCEFATDAPDVTDVLVSIGGGGLISGVATAFRALAPHVRMWGVETEGADAMSRALAAGEPVAAPLHLDRHHAQRAEGLRAHVRTRAQAGDRGARRVRRGGGAGTVALAEHAKVWAEPAAGCLVPAARRVLERVGGPCHLGLLVCGGNATLRRRRGAGPS